MAHSIRKFVVRSTSESSARAYHYSFESGGWAIFTVNDTTGELNVQSDWGNFGHRWGPSGLGDKTISQAIASWADAHYLCDKLFYDRPQGDRREVDADATKRVMRDAARSRGTPDVQGIIDGLEFDDVDSFYNALSDETQFRDGFLGDAYDWLVTRPTAKWEIMTEQLLPPFIATLRQEQGLEPSPAATHHVVAP